MATFLIDYAKLGEGALSGTELLLAGDTVELFLREEAKSMPQRTWDALVGSGCTIVAYLVPAGAPSSTFIAMELGRLAAMGGGDTIAIIPGASATGAVMYGAVLGWGGGRGVVFQSSIRAAAAFFSGKDAEDRRPLMRKAASVIDIPQAIAGRGKETRARGRLLAAIGEGLDAGYLIDMANALPPEELKKKLRSSFGAARGSTIAKALTAYIEEMQEGARREDGADVPDAPDGAGAHAQPCASGGKHAPDGQATDDGQKGRDRAKEPVKPRIYYVDLENTGAAFASWLPPLSAKDEVHIFVSKNSASIESKEISEFIGNTQASVSIHEAPKKALKNGMDIAISGLMGHHVAEMDGDCQYIIVSKDKGYDAAIAAIKDAHGQDTDISRISGRMFSTEGIDAMAKAVGAIFVNGGQARRIQELIVGAKGSYAALEASLADEFGGAKGANIYKTVSAKLGKLCHATGAD